MDRAADTRRRALELPDVALARELPAGDDVRVYSASLDLSPEVDRELRALLTDDERTRAAGYPDSARAVRFARGRGLLRHLLGETLGRPASALRFENNRDGKPALAGAEAASGLQFNLSHAPRLVLLAISTGRRVGADVAWTGGSTRLDGVVARFFSPPERDTYAAALPAHRRQLFTRIWVRKEAYLKGRGEGISEWIHTTDFTGDSVAPGRGDQEAWELRDVAGLPEGYVGSIALERERR